MEQEEKRKICVFSGKRGGFGAYAPLMQLIQKDPNLELQILLGDMHTSVQFGKTADEARALFPDAKIELIEMGAGRGDSPLIRAENLGVAMTKAAGILDRTRPDIVLVHADRGEHLMVAFAALNLGISVAHTQGGEMSGNIDDTQRHAISKLAHIHFPETEEAARRLRILGEEDWRIHVVGSTYIDRIVKKMFPPSKETRKKYGLRVDEKYYIIIFHPDTLETREANYAAMQNILRAMESTGLRSFVVYPCSDPGYEGVLRAVEEVGNNFPFMIYKNIENLDFLSLMSEAEALVGNSSSAFVEAPQFHLPAINIGRRQIGRDREENVLDVGSDCESIVNALSYVRSDARFQESLARCGYRLGKGTAAEKIINVLKSVPLDERLLRKKLQST